MKIDEQNAQEKIMDDLLTNIHKASLFLTDNYHLLSSSGIKEQKEKISKLTFLYNELIQKREDKSGRKLSLHDPTPQSAEEKRELFKLINEE